MSERDKKAEGMTLLGSNGTQYPTDYDPSLLETFENKLRQVQLPGIYFSLPDNGSAGLRDDIYFIRSESENG